MSIADLMEPHDKFQVIFCLFLFASFDNYFYAPLFFGIESFWKVYFWGKEPTLGRFEADLKTSYACSIFQCTLKPWGEILIENQFISTWKTSRLDRPIWLSCGE